MANWQIPITENGKTTLATAGKYCDRNIDINVEVEGGGEGGGAYDITATTNTDGTQSLSIVDAGGGGAYTPIETVTITVMDEAYNAAVPINVIYVNSQGTFGSVTVATGSSAQLEVMKDTFVAFENVGTMDSKFHSGVTADNCLFTDKSVWRVSDGQTYTRTAWGD